MKKGLNVKLTRLLSLVLAAFIIPAAINAQVTTSSITGSVTLTNGDPLEGATVVAIHTPTGSRYTTTSQKSGQFNFPNVTPGGPYTVTATFVGLTPYQKTDIIAPLGDRYNIIIELSSSVKELQNIVISGRGSGLIKTGASTNFSSRQIQTQPNIGRSITGLTKTSPQANGNSFAGMNERYNNITIDGALFNNNFGRSGDGMIPGGGVSAISIDALDQIQLNIAPYDVRQAGFVGGGINAVTKRGTNTFTGTVYGFYRNQDFNGDKVKGVEFANAKKSTKIYGASVGGPIVKDKLFFFVNAEKEERTQPGQISVAKKPGVNDNDPNVTVPLASDLDKLSQYLKSTYNYDPGAYEGYDFATDNFKFVTRLDWNISNKNRLTLRYNQSETNDDNKINSNSGPSGISRFSNSRGGGSPNAGLNFSGSNFKNNTKVNSTVAELNSTFSSKVSNQLIASYTRNQPVRIPNSTFPFVDIMNGSSVYTSFGTDLYSYENKIDDKAYNIADNVTMNFGKHSLTAGASYDYFAVKNFFADAGGPGYYRFASLQDFLDNKPPVFFALTYGYDKKNPGYIPPAEATFGQVSVYLQDAWSINEKFKLTYGLRVDKPLYTFDAPKNPALQEVNFKDVAGNNETFDVSKWPKSRLLFSPRVGFNYTIPDENLVIRGGTGVFTGRIPFIWLSNQVADNGVLRSIWTVSSPADLANYPFSPDRSTYFSKIPIPDAGTTIPAGRPSYSATVPDFKMPQVWRTSLAFDKKFATNYIFTLEGIFTKFINNVYFRNANLGAQDGTLNSPGDGRPYYSPRLNDNISLMTVMDNVNKGSSMVFTAQLQRSFSKNWTGSLAYTYTFANDLNIGTSDRASSSWSTNNIVDNPNQPELSYSNFSVPHRVVANFSYKFNYLKDHMATNIGLYYSGSSQERYHFRYNSDVNGDGQTNDLIYIPYPSQITFVEGYKVGSKIFSAQQQKDAYFTFVDNNPYLKKHEGQYMDRNGALLPWVNSLDLRILQDFSFNTSKRKQTIQFSIDVVNLLNLLDNNWGTRYSYNFGSFSDQGILGIPSSANNTGGENFNKEAPKFTFNPDGPASAYRPDYSTYSTWGIQLGLRYIF
ncbi:MAG: TonB-dependent receptor [Ginsengibacter sp.]